VAEVYVSEQVRRVMGDEAVARAREVVLTEAARCGGCDRPLPVDGATNLVVIERDGTGVVRWAHTGCLPSDVYTGPDVHAVPEMTDMTMVAGVGVTAAGPVPFLVAAPNSRVYNRPGGELVDGYLSHLLGEGFELVDRLDVAPSSRPVGWSLRFDGAGSAVLLHVLDAGGGPFYLGEVEVPEGWDVGVRRDGGCLIYTGAIAVVDGDPGATVATLEALAARGELVAGWVALA